MESIKRKKLIFQILNPIPFRLLKRNGIEEVTDFFDVVGDFRDMPFKIFLMELLFFESLKFFEDKDLERRTQPVAKTEGNILVSESATTPNRFSKNADSIGFLHPSRRRNSETIITRWQKITNLTHLITTR